MKKPVMKIHFRNIRLKVNAGMNYPECQSYAQVLDTGMTRWITTTDKKEVNCKNCLRVFAHTPRLK